MRAVIVRRLRAAVCVTSLLAIVACTPTGRLRTDVQEIDLGGAESVRTVIRMGAGELRISGGAHKLAEATFRYNVSSWRPDIDYDRTGSRGRLSIRQRRGVSLFHVGNAENAWDVRLNNNVPMDLEVALGAGESRLELGGMSLRRLEIEMGAGELRLDLTGAWKHDLDVRIRGGVGEANVRLPHNVGVIVEARGGLGGIQTRGLKRRGDSYVNEAYDDSKVTLRLDIKGGIGQINLIAEEGSRV